MDNFFPAIQLIGAVTFGILALMLIMSRRYKSPHYYIYRRSEHLLVISQALLSVHFIIQFCTGWRLTNPDRAIFVNMIFFPLTGMLMLFALLNLLRKGDISRPEKLWGLWGYLCMTILLVFGGFNRQILPIIETFNSFGYTIMFSIYSLLVYKEYKNAAVRMDNYFSNDTTSSIRWIVAICLGLAVCVLCIPFAILSNNGFLKLVTMISFVIIIVFVNRFIFFGYDVLKMIDHYFEVVEADSMERQQAEKSAHKPTEGKKEDMVERAIQSALHKWQLTGAYTNPDLTIEDVVKQTGMRRASIANYLNGTLGLSFRSWLTTIRIDEAKRLMLQHPDYSHETIAEMSGFSSRTYFLKVFKDKEGLTPGEWLKAQ